MKMHLANRSIYNLLELAAAKGGLIEVSIRHRGIGKTKALVEYANDNGFYVLVQNNDQARVLSKEYGCKRVKSINGVLDGIRHVVVDETITRGQIAKAKAAGLFIVTGFVREENFYEGFKS